MNVNYSEESKEVSEDQQVVIPLLRTHGPNNIMENSKDNTTSIGGALFVLINAALGGGLLAFPYAFWSSGGIVVGIILQAILVAFVVGSLMSLAKGVDVTSASSFEGVVRAMCGRVLGVVCQLCIALYTFGTTIAFLVIIGDQLVDVSSAFTLKNSESLSDQWYFDRKFAISILSVLFILPFLMLKNIGSLSYTSILGVVSCVYIAIIVTIKYFLLRHDEHYFSCHRPQQLHSHCHRSWPDVFNAIPLICFGYQCHVSSVPIYAGLRKRSLKRYSLVVAMGMLVCVGVYTLTGTFGYLTFTDQPTCIDADILRNYCPCDVPISIARVMLILCIITSYPILHFVGRSALDSTLVAGLLTFTKVKEETLDRWQLTRHRVEATVWFFLSVLFAIFIPDIVKVIQPLGGLAATFIFIFPGCCLLQMVKPPVKYSRSLTVILYISGSAFIIVGFYIFGDSFVYSLMSSVGIIES